MISSLFFDDLEELHRTGLGADAAGDALGGKFTRLGLDHHAEGTCLDTLAAAGAELLVDGVDAFRVLRDGAVGTCFGTFAALDAEHRLGRALAVDDLKTCLSGIKFFVEGCGAGANALESCHAGYAHFLRGFF